MATTLVSVRRFAQAAAILVPLAAAACNALLSVDDFKIGSSPDGSVPPDAATTGSDSGSGSVDGGTPPQHDAAQPQTDSATPDSAASSACVPSSLPLDASSFTSLVHQCLLWAACDPNAPVPDDCVTNNKLAASPEGACLMDASTKTCDDIEKCTGRSFLPSDASICNATAPLGYSTGICDDAGNAVQCMNNGTLIYRSTVTNCASQGGTCGVYPWDPSSPQTLAGCAVTHGCGADNASYYTCSGESAVSVCWNDAGFGQNCSKIVGGEAQCFVGAGGDGVGCLVPTDGGFCDPSSTEPTCANSTTMLACNPAGYMEPFDCGRAGLTCQDGNGCTFPSCTQNDFNNCADNEGCPNANVPSALAICVSGILLQVDCAAQFGKGWTCQQSVSSAATGTQSYCLPPQ